MIAGMVLGYKDSGAWDPMCDKLEGLIPVVLQRSGLAENRGI